MIRERENKIRNAFGIFNFFFLVCSIIFIGIGATILTAYQNFDHILTAKFYSIPTFMIVCGAVAFIIGFLGCCGAFQQSFCMVISFIILLILLFIFELSAGIAGYVLRDDISYILKTEMTSSIEMYTKDVYTSQRFWDYLQVEYNCCGATNYQDWIIALNGGEDLPLSCCDTTGVIGEAYCRLTDKQILRLDGCVDSFGESLKGHAGTIGATGIAIALIQLFGIIFAIFVARNIRRSRY